MGVRSKEFGVGRNVDRSLVKYGLGYLRGQSAFPDEIVEPGLARFQRAFHDFRILREVRGADGFVRLLRALAFGPVASGGAGILIAVFFFDYSLSLSKGILGKIDRVSAHISDVAAFVELLGEHHGLLGREAKLAGGFLLQSGSGKGSRWRSARFFFSNVC